MLNRLNPTGSELREFLTNKGKSESFQTSPSCYQQVGCQLVMVHSVHCRLGSIPATPNRRSVFDRLSEQDPVKHHKRNVSQDLPSASVNMIVRGREPRRGRQAPHAANSPPFSSPDLDYSRAYAKSWCTKKASSETPDPGSQNPTVMSSHPPQPQ